MARLFISHSSDDKLKTMAVVEWLTENGYGDLFRDFIPDEKGLYCGVAWEKALWSEIQRADAVICLFSKSWLSKDYCRKEHELAGRFGKKIFGVQIDGDGIDDIPEEFNSKLKAEFQIVSLSAGHDHILLEVSEPGASETKPVHFSKMGLLGLNVGLQLQDLHPDFFAWPPKGAQGRSPYPGLSALEAQDAGIFLGREGPTSQMLDMLRREAEQPTGSLFCIQGASGAGKSSFLKAGIWPRLQRDTLRFLALPVLRAQPNILLSENDGLVQSLVEATGRLEGARSRREICDVLGLPYHPLPRNVEPPELDPARVAQALIGLLEGFQAERRGWSAGLAGAPPLQAPAIVICVDQAEELVAADEEGWERKVFLAILTTLAKTSRLRVITVLTIRTADLDRLQAAGPLVDLEFKPFALGPFPKGHYGQVITGPLEQLKGTDWEIRFDSGLVDQLLQDMEHHGGSDALPLLAFILRRLYDANHKAGGRTLISLQSYADAGGLAGAVEKAVADALQRARRGDDSPQARAAQEKRLGEALVPWLVRADHESGLRRRVADFESLPAELKPLVSALVEEKLLIKHGAAPEGDRDGAGRRMVTVEIAHESVLRLSSVISRLIEDKKPELEALDRLVRAAVDWELHERAPTDGRARGAGKTSLLLHRDDLLAEAEDLLALPQFELAAGPTAKDYLRACRAHENARLTRARTIQRRWWQVLGVAAGFIVLLALGVVWMIQRTNERRSNTLAALARDAARSGRFDLALRYALAGTIGADAPGIGFDATEAVEQLKILYQSGGALAALRHADGEGRPVQVRAATFSGDGSKILTASFNGKMTLWDAASGAVIREFPGHTGKVQAALFSPDEERVVSVAFDSTARLWDARDARKEPRILAHNISDRRAVQLWSAAFTHDGDYLLTADDTGELRTWDGRTGELKEKYPDIAYARGGEPLVSPPLHAGTVQSVSAHPSARVFAAAWGDGSVQVWEVGNPARRMDISRPPEATSGQTLVAFSPDGKRLAVGYQNGCVGIIELKASDPQSSRPQMPGPDLLACGAKPSGAPPSSGGQADAKAGSGHTNFIHELSFDPSHPELLLSASSDGQARIWNTTRLTSLRVFSPQTSPTASSGEARTLRTAAFSPDGQLVVTAGDDAIARLWEAKTGKLLFTYVGHEEAIWRARFSPDGTRFVTASADGTARVWDATLREENIAVTLKGHAKRVRAVAVSPDGAYIASGSFEAGDETVILWELASGAEVVRLAAGQVQALAFSPDGTRLAASTVDSNLAIVWAWHDCVRTRTDSCRDGEPMRHATRVMGIALAPGGQLLATASRDARATLWDLSERGKYLRYFPHRSGASSVAFSPDGRLAASTSYDDAFIWGINLSEGPSECPLNGHSAAVRDVTFSPDGTMVLTASEDHTVRFWRADLERCEELKPAIELPLDSVWSARFSPDGKEVVISSERLRQIHVFDTKTRREVATLTGHQGPVYAALFSPVDDRKVISASADHTVRVWTLPARRAMSEREAISLACTQRLAAGLSRFTKRELEGAPVLDPILDQDPCLPSSPYIRQLKLLFPSLPWLQ